ncbi:MAG: hypothetical protein AB7K71_30780 [Polyangiaceae bacterium]
MSIPCDRCQSPLEPQDLRCPICSQAAPEQDHPPESRAFAEVLRCNDCGAAVSYTIAHQAPRCHFCGSVMHIERPEDPLEEPQWYLPFRIGPEQASQLLRQWLDAQRGFFTPTELASEATLSSLAPLWWVAWVCNANALVTWTADSNAGSKKAYWAPHAGSGEMQFRSLLIPATRGLTYDEASYLTPGYDTRSREQAAHGPPHTPIERFDVQRSVARSHVVESIHRAAAAQLNQTAIPGSSKRKIQVSALLSSLSTDRYALPAYVLAYRFRGQLYRAIVHGQDPRYVWGRTPRTYLRLYIILGVIFLVLFFGLLSLIVLAAL